jgi:galactose-1-phosphate uridylyltransferase
MSELRQNLATREWVIIAPERGSRPQEIKEKNTLQDTNISDYNKNCPFCPNNEDKFPLVETYRISEKNKNWLCRSIENKRIIYQNDYFAGLIPYAAGMPHETWIIPKIHHAGFNKTTENEKIDFADILHKILEKFYIALNNPDFNYVIFSAPYSLSEVPFIRKNPRLYLEYLKL